MVLRVISRQSVSELALIGAALLAPLPAYAQPAQETAVEDADDDNVIIVQARRVDESLQDVPLAVTALAGETLRQGGIDTPQDLSTRVPSLQVTPSTGRRDTVTFGIRSQVAIQPRMDNDPAVGVYFSEVNISRPFGLNQSLYDLASVQVLKGPQGTLFGRNSTGGAVLFQPNRPEFDAFGGSFEAEYGSYDYRAATAVVNLPLGDVAALRLAGRIAKRDGFTRNLLTGVALDDLDNRSWRVSLLLRPRHNIEILTVYDDYDAEENGASTFIAFANPCPAGLASCLFPGLQNALSAQSARDIHEVSLDGRIFSNVENRGVSNIVTIDLGENVRLKNIFGWRQIEVASATDLDGSQFPVLNAFQNVEAEQITVEPQIQLSLLDETLDLILGGYYYRETGIDSAPIVVFGGLVNRPFSGGPVRNVAHSVFAQGNYAFRGIPGLSATAGIRYTWDDRSLSIQTVNANGSCAFVGDTPPCDTPASVKFDAPSWTLGLDYRFNDDLMVYVVSRRGYRAGGLGLTALNQASLQPYRSEQLTDVELGVKSDFRIGGAPARLNLSGYYAEADDLQRFIFVGTAATLATINAASAHFYGFEAEAWVRPVPGLTLSVFYNLDKGVYDRFDVELSGVVGLVDVSASRFPYTPEQKFGATIRYETPIGSIGDLALQADYFWQSDSYSNAINAIEPLSRIGGYDVVNLRAELSGIGGLPLDIAVFVRNLFDEDYAVSSGLNSQRDFGVTSLQSGEPRMVGMQARVWFGK